MCNWCHHVQSRVGTGVGSDGTSSTDAHSCCVCLKPELLKGCKKLREGLFCDSRNLRWKVAPEGVESVDLRPWCCFLVIFYASQPSKSRELEPSCLSL